MKKKHTYALRGVALALLVASCSGKEQGGPFGANATNGNGSPYAGLGGPQFPGAGTSFAGAPLNPALGPETANECSKPPPIGAKSDVVSTDTLCFYGDTPTPDVPAATVEEIVEVVAGQKVVHIRITFDPNFVDNSYGDNAVGWGTPQAMMAPAPAPAPAPGGAMMGKGGAMAPKPKPGKGGHTFKDLVGSDHVELKLFDAGGKLSLHVAVDYISQDSSSPCGYGTLGVTGGEGKVFVGSASDVLAVATSLDRDLNGCGYCMTESSPATDSSYTPNPDTPKWDYRVVYELWIDAAVFGSTGFGQALVDFVHASPSKLDSNTVNVVHKPCPPHWDVPYCTTDTSGEGANCGTKTAYPDGGVCPPGWVPDLASEGKFCVPG
jgi:hypothetical protein